MKQHIVSHFNFIRYLAYRESRENTKEKKKFNQIILKSDDHVKINVHSFILGLFYCNLMHFEFHRIECSKRSDNCNDGNA